MLMMSTSSRATISRQSEATKGMSNSRAAASAFSRWPLAIATTRAPSHARKAGNCVVRAKPVPMMPMPTVSRFDKKASFKFLSSDDSTRAALLLFPSLPLVASALVRGRRADRRPRRRLMIVRVRWTHVLLRRILLQVGEQQLDRLLQLRVAPRAPSDRIELHFNVGRDAVILDLPIAVESVDRCVRRGGETAVHQLRHT